MLSFNYKKKHNINRINKETFWSEFESIAKHKLKDQIHNIKMDNDISILQGKTTVFDKWEVKFSETNSETIVFSKFIYGQKLNKRVLLTSILLIAFFLIFNSLKITLLIVLPLVIIYLILFNLLYRSILKALSIEIFNTIETKYKTAHNNGS